MGLLDRRFALKILSWKHSGFSVDASVSIPASSKKARVNLSQYIIRHPGNPADCLQKILYVCSNGTVIYKTKYNEYFKKNIKLFSAADFIAELTMHIPPKHKHLIRYYGLYSSRTRGKATRDGSLAKYGYTSTPQETPGQDSDLEMENVSNKASRRSWARLIQKVYEVDPLICPKCGHALKVMAVITEPHEVRKILECLKRNHAPPFDKVVTKAS
jgi:hydroxymethylpyrimidine pyrophosphatase-like HAD family hydrolase